MTVKEKLDDLFDDDCPHDNGAPDARTKNECRRCTTEFIRAAVEEAVKAERERCAKKSEERAEQLRDEYERTREHDELHAAFELDEIAAAFRGAK